MEVPRLDHALNSPTSPCEEVIKNLSLEAIQLCDRDGKSGRDHKERGAEPAPRRRGGPGSANPARPGGKVFCCPLCANKSRWVFPSAHPPSPQTPETKGPRG